MYPIVCYNILEKALARFMFLRKESFMQAPQWLIQLREWLDRDVPPSRGSRRVVEITDALGRRANFPGGILVNRSNCIVKYEFTSVQSGGPVPIIARLDGILQPGQERNLDVGVLSWQPAEQGE